MHVFKLQKASLKKLANLQMAKLTPLITLTMLSALVIADELKNGEIFKDKNALFIILGFFLILLIAGSIKGRNEVIKVLAATTFKVSDDYIEKIAPNAAPVKIYFRDIRSVTRGNTGMYFKGKKNKLQIPKVLENYKQLQEIIRLKTNSGISYNDSKFKFNEIFLSYLASILLLILGVSLLKLNDPIYKLYVSIPLIIMLTAGVVKINTDKHTSHEIVEYTPKIIILILVIISYLVYTFLK